MVIDGCNYHDQILTRDAYFKEHMQSFRAIFGFDAPKDFLLYAIGQGLSLDVIELDKRLRTPDGISTNDYILQQYGDKTLEMVKNMI